MRKGHSADLRKGRVSIPGGIYHIRFCSRHRKPVFGFDRGRLLAQIIHRTAQRYDIELLCWVIMPDHVHLLIQLQGQTTLRQFVRKLKADYTRHSGNPSQWQDGYFDRAIRRDEDVKTVARYIVANPLRAGIVQSVRDYSLWDAVWL